MEYTKSEAKQWAKEHYRGLENTLMPSFTPDLAQLDEEGIRHDVRFSIEQGFFSTLCCLEATLLRHLHVHNHDVKVLCTHGNQYLFAIFRSHHGVPTLLEQPDHHRTVHCIILRDENPEG